MEPVSLREAPDPALPAAVTPPGGRWIMDALFEPAASIQDRDALRRREGWHPGPDTMTPEFIRFRWRSARSNAAQHGMACRFMSLGPTQRHGPASARCQWAPGVRVVDV
jgi:hypothetical protein